MNTPTIHPSTRHYCESVCARHPVGLAWVALRWAGMVRPRVIMLMVHDGVIIFKGYETKENSVVPISQEINGGENETFYKY